MVMLREAVNDNQRVVALINALSGTLNNIDAEFQLELARAKSTSRPDIRPIVVERVRRRHEQRREPYVRQIAELRRRIHPAEACA
jgi:hypothetical protein